MLIELVHMILVNLVGALKFRYFCWRPIGTYFIICFIISTFYIIEGWAKLGLVGV